MQGEPDMDRRSFVGGSLGAALGPTLAAGAHADPQGTSASGAAARPQIFELRRYQFRFGPMEMRYAEYAKNALVPALNRAGIKPVGAFSVSMGPDTPAVYILLPHPNAESVVTLASRITADAEYRQAATSFRSLPVNDPPYVRRQSNLLVAFESTPVIEVPTSVPSRLFELRTYESHNETAGLKKIEMFEKGGEIGIFRRVGVLPVFFGRDVVGAHLPSLTYMVAFADSAAREKAWAAFRDDAEWGKLRATPGLSNADIVTNITATLLRPTDYSQI